MSLSDDESAVLRPWSRRNTDADTEVVQEVVGHKLCLKQEPSSLHLGLTVWDASIVCAKYLEKQSRRGKKGPSRDSDGRPKKKYALELGSGPGLAGMAAALVGWHTTVTDTADVVPLLKKNVDINFSGRDWLDSISLRERFGGIEVKELDWTKPEQLNGFNQHYDLIIATDCVYHEHLIHDLLRVMLHCSDSKTTVLVCNEFRSESVQQEFKTVFSGHFSIRPVSSKHMHEYFSDENIQLSVLTRRRKPTADAVLPSAEARHQGAPGAKTC